MHRLYLVGLNHTTAPVAVREKLVFSPPQQAEAMAAFAKAFADAEAVLLSTCNRVELYVARGVHGHPRTEEMISFLAGFHGLPVNEVADHLYQKTEREAVSHLFSVAASLDSMVLGETQILGQVRHAYDTAKAAGTAKNNLHPLFQRALAVGKQVMTSTSLAEGRLSIASVAVDYAKQIFDHFGDKTVLSIGAGKMATLALRSFQALSPGRLLICNRNPEKAAGLAVEFGGHTALWEQLDDHLAIADIVISGTGATQPIITADRFAHVVKKRRYRPIFLIDIALPRDIEEGVGDLENVYLYNIDDLQAVVASTQDQRAGSVATARQIIEQQVQEYAAWHRAREMGPLIERLYRHYQSMASEEVARTVKKLGDIGPHEREHLEDLARRIVNKLLHEPIRGLRQSNSLDDPAVNYLRSMDKLLGLSKDDHQQQEAEPHGHEDTKADS